MEERIEIFPDIKKVIKSIPFKIKDKYLKASVKNIKLMEEIISDHNIRVSDRDNLLLALNIIINQNIGSELSFFFLKERNVSRKKAEKILELINLFETHQPEPKDLPNITISAFNSEGISYPKIRITEPFLLIEIFDGLTKILSDDSKMSKHKVDQDHSTWSRKTFIFHLVNLLKELGIKTKDEAYLIAGKLMLIAGFSFFVNGIEVKSISKLKEKTLETEIQRNIRSEQLQYCRRKK